MTPLRLGILGFAHGHVNIYARRWQAEPELGVALAAGWDPDPERLARAAGDFGLRACPSAEAVLDGGVDAVVIAAETSLHADLVEKAAAAGKAIVLQKPLCLTLAEADRIVAAVEAAGVPFTLAWQMRVDPENLRMRELLGDGSFGAVHTIRRRHTLGVLLDPAFHRSWHVDPELNRDLWADDAAHAADFMYWLFGMPESVTAELAVLTRPPAGTDTGIAIFRYADGLLAEVSCSFANVAGENTTEITAERAVIVQNYGDGPSTARKPPGAISLKWMRQGDTAWTVEPCPGVASQGERIAALAAPLAEFLRGRREALATAREGRDVLRMILACTTASAEGRRVRLDGPLPEKAECAN